MLNIENYIGGGLVNPATGNVYSRIADSDDRDVNLAVEAAKAAFTGWSSVSAEERHDVMMRIVGLIDRDLELLAEAESVDNGKPVTLARTVDIPRAVSNFTFYATAAMHLSNESHYTAGQAINYT